MTETRSDIPIICTLPTDVRTGLRTGEVADRAGVNVQTLRYYERRGLIAEPIRSVGGHRAYPPDTVGLIATIKAAQRLGFTLDEVADLLAARRDRPTADLRRRAREKLADLAAIRAALAEVVAAECDSLTDCTCPDCPLPLASKGDQP